MLAESQVQYISCHLQHLKPRLLPMLWKDRGYKGISKSSVEDKHRTSIVIRTLKSRNDPFFFFAFSLFF